MKKILLLCLIIVCSFSALTVLSAEYNNYIDFAKQSDDVDITTIDEELIYIAELRGPEGLLLDEAGSYVYVIMPKKDSTDFMVSYFETGEYKGTFSGNAPLLENLKYYDINTFKQYLQKNGLSDARNVKAVIVTEGVYYYVYRFESNGVKYVIPFFKGENSDYNITENPEFEFEIGKAYTAEEFVDICEKAEKVYSDFRKQERENEQKVVVTTDDNGDKVINKGNEILGEFDEHEILNKENDIQSDLKKDETSSAEENSNKVYNDIDLSIEDNKRLVNALTDLGKYNLINGYEDGSFRPDNSITRAEMIQLICNLKFGANIDYYMLEFENSYEDIDEGHWAYKCIELMTTSGLIKGDGDGKVRPDDCVTYDEVIVMLVRTLGYEPYVDTFFPYPASYMIKATEIGITRNVTCVAAEYAKRRDVAIMLKNTIDIPLVVTAGFDAETGAKYEILDGTDGKEKRTLRTDSDKIIEQENNN